MTSPLRERAIAYFRDTPDEVFWSTHWASQSLEHLLQVAEISELTRLLDRHIHPGDRLLEAGCGLGQYVVHFASHGVRAVGVDWSREAIKRHRAAFPSSDVRVADLERLPFPDASFDVYLSLGVLEHDEEGGSGILREAYRVLVDGGTLILSTPYVNATRRALRRRIERRQRELARSGAAFYQYAFDERTLDELLAAQGFRVVERSYYDPGRGLRDLRALLSAAPRQAPTVPRAELTPPRRHGPIKRRLLYARLTLKMLAHMQIIRAEKRSDT